MGGGLRCRAPDVLPRSEISVDLRSHPQTVLSVAEGVCLPEGEEAYDQAEGIGKMIKVSPGQQPGKEQVGPSAEAGGGRRQHPRVFCPCYPVSKGLYTLHL